MQTQAIFSEVGDKIMVFGLPGSGKSTFATELANELDLPIYHLDKYFYLENWVERDKQEFLEIQKTFVNQPKWVIDGNAMQSLEMRFQKADTVIYFCFPIFVCLWRMLKRIFCKNGHISDVAEGCKKSLPLRLIKYTIRFHKRYHSKIEELRKKYPYVNFYIIESDSDTKSFLHSVRKMRKSI